MNVYKQRRPEMRTGDILLFSGRGLISRGIQAITGSRWSHVALVLEVPEYDFVCCFESTTLSDIPDLTTGAAVKGVQLVPLSQRLDSYDGAAVAWRPVDAPRSAATVAAALAVRREFAGRPYEENQIELLRAALDTFSLRQNQPDASSVFCSELTAIMWQRMGWLNSHLAPNEFTPVDFAGDTLPHMQGVTLGEIELLT